VRPGPGGGTGAGWPGGLRGLAAGFGSGVASGRVAAGGGPPPGDVTTRGLARRVRGAQLPPTAPMAVHRTGGAPPPPTAPPPVPETAAEQVYSYLTSFSAGVQRGLDESRRARG
jgi:hypothetical protein